MNTPQSVPMPPGLDLGLGHMVDPQTGHPVVILTFKVGQLKCQAQMGPNDARGIARMLAVRLPEAAAAAEQAAAQTIAVPPLNLLLPPGAVPR